MVKKILCLLLPFFILVGAIIYLLIPFTEKENIATILKIEDAFTEKNISYFINFLYTLDIIFCIYMSMLLYLLFILFIFILKKIPSVRFKTRFYLKKVFLIILSVFVSIIGLSVLHLHSFQEMRTNDSINNLKSVTCYDNICRKNELSKFVENSHIVDVNTLMSSEFLIFISVSIYILIIFFMNYYLNKILLQDNSKDEKENEKKLVMKYYTLYSNNKIYTEFIERFIAIIGVLYAIFGMSTKTKLISIIIPLGNEPSSLCKMLIEMTLNSLTSVSSAILYCFIILVLLICDSLHWEIQKRQMDKSE